MKVLVELHGWGVNVYSSEGVGSRFFLTIHFNTLADAEERIISKVI